MANDSDYSEKQGQEEAAYEARCRRCGGCCGAYDSDPCARLRKDEAGKYYCSVYDHRIGMQKTVSGKNFACVPIRILQPNLPFKGCAYYEKA